jgi:hypothetical protein
LYCPGKLRLRGRDSNPDNGVQSAVDYRLSDPARRVRRIAISRKRTRDRVRQLLEEGKGVNEIARVLALNSATVSYHKRRLGYPMSDHCALRYDWAAVQRYYDEGHSVRQCVKHFGFSSASWTDAVNRGALIPRPRAMPLGELLGNRPRSRRNIKLRLIAAGLKENRCEECGLTEWRGRPLNMALHHVNGDGTDNRLVNLLLLCPNCHAQTPNYGGRNGHRRSVAQGGPAGRPNGDRPG